MFLTSNVVVLWHYIDVFLTVIAFMEVQESFGLLQYL